MGTGFPVGLRVSISLRIRGRWVGLRRPPVLPAKHSIAAWDRPGSARGPASAARWPPDSLTKSRVLAKTIYTMSGDCSTYVALSHQKLTCFDPFRGVSPEKWPQVLGLGGR